MGEGRYKALKIVKSAFVSSLFVLFGYVALQSGSDPTLTMMLTIMSLALVNGVELTEWVEAKRALDESQDDEDA